jgi:hypothetical protein
MPITEKQRKELERLSAMPDSEIDTTDIPEVTSERLYPALSEADKARVLHNLAQSIAVGAVKKPRYKVTSIDEGRKDAGR